MEQEMDRKGQTLSHNPPEEILAGLLRERGWTIATAESCTGGLIAGALTNVAGVSACFQEGIVTYSNGAKEKYLGVDHQTLARFGAVSGETADEMTRGILRTSGADVAIAVTGIAGPDGGSPQKPVGLVYIGYGSPDDVRIQECRFDGDRHQIRRQTVEKALWLAVRFVEEKK